MGSHVSTTSVMCKRRPLRLAACIVIRPAPQREPLPQIADCTEQQDRLAPGGLPPAAMKLARLELLLQRMSMQVGRAFVSERVGALGTMSKSTEALRTLAVSRCLRPP